MTLEAALRDELPKAAQAIAGLSADQINWRPAEGAWSIGECIAHLNAVNGLYADSIHAAIVEARKRGLTYAGEQREPKLFERWFLKTMAAPRIKFKAPSKFQPAATALEPDRLLAAWKSSHERLVQLAESAHGLDLLRVKVPSPVTSLLKVSLLCALTIPVAHNQRHLLQIARLRQRIESTRAAASR
ncbi:MAG TPA: DinB family protein [Bryobacteraceae bacterium]|nr:DinB family protein [Bryobacteraceae bacterium]